MVMDERDKLWGDIRNRGQRQAQYEALGNPYTRLTGVSPGRG